MSDYYFLITDAGKALEVAAHASGEPVKLTEFAVGDGNGEPVTPDTAQTALVNEVYRDVISSLTVNPTDTSVLEAECIIPASSGGYTIREIGIFADDGTLYATGSFAEQDKPAPDSGYAASLQIFAELAVSDTSDITLTVQDGSYLTEPQGDTLYLRQDKNLSEIAGQGEEAQAEARDNLGLTDMSTANPEDFVPTSGGSVDYLTGAKYYNTLAGAWQGAGGFYQQYTDGTAPFCVPYGYATPENGSLYLPICKGVSYTDVAGYGCAVSFGALRSGLADFGQAVIHLCGDDGTTAGFYFDISGNLSFSGQVVPGNLDNFDNRYPIRDGISNVGLSNDDVNNPYMRQTSTGNVILLAAQSWCVSNFVVDVSLGMMGSYSVSSGTLESPPGCVLTGGGDFGADNGSYYYRPLQKYINGAWHTVGTTA